MKYSELWQLLGETGPQIGLVLAVVAIALTVYGLSRNLFKLRGQVRGEMEGHRKELLELQASTLEFMTLDDDVLRGKSNLTDYNPNILFLTYEYKQDRETIALLYNLKQRCKDQFSRSVCGEAGDEMRSYANDSIGNIEKVI